MVYRRGWVYPPPPRVEATVAVGMHSTGMLSAKLEFSSQTSHVESQI